MRVSRLFPFDTLSKSGCASLQMNQTFYRVSAWKQVQNVTIYNLKCCIQPFKIAFESMSAT